MLWAQTCSSGQTESLLQHHTAITLLVGQVSPTLSSEKIKPYRSEVRH